MAYFWATWLRPALEADPFVKARLIVDPGWETRGRPSAQFNFLPTGIIEHHTACMCRVGHDPATCLAYNKVGRIPEAPGPISQLLGTWTAPGTKWNGSNPDPRIILVAAGRANHAGVGAYPWGAPAGNGSALGIEWCGPSETYAWPDVVIELRERVTAAILRHQKWSVNQVTTHWGYATPQGRKIDPSGAYKHQPTLAWNAHWDPAVWKQALAKRLAAPVVPPVVPVPPVGGGTAPSPVVPPPTTPTPTPAPNWTEVIVNTLPTIAPGATNAAAVKRVQGLLVANGFNPGTIDGIYGSATGPTGKAIAAFQAARKLLVDGVVGRQTWTALLGG